MNAEADLALAALSRLRPAPTYSGTVNDNGTPYDSEMPRRQVTGYDECVRHLSEEELSELMGAEMLSWDERLRLAFHFGLACSECWETLRSLGAGIEAGPTNSEPLIQTLRLLAFERQSQHFFSVKRLFDRAPSDPASFFRILLEMSYELPGVRNVDPRWLVRSSMLASLVALQLEAHAAQELLGWTKAYLAESRQDRGNPERARALLVQAWTHWRHSGQAPELAASLLSTEARIFRLEGQPAAAARRLGEAVALLPTRGFEADRVETLLRLAEISIEAHDLERARTALDEARSIIEAAPEACSPSLEFRLREGMMSFEISSAENKLSRGEDPSAALIAAAEVFLDGAERLDDDAPDSQHRRKKLQARLAAVWSAIDSRGGR